VLYSAAFRRYFPAGWQSYVHASEVLLSPILVRPVREQLEHDRVIRLLQAKYKRKFDVGINPGHEQTAPVGNPPSPWFPDLVLQSTERSRKLLGVVEVETTESVNHLEAMSQWVAFSKLKAFFHLYVPTNAIDSTRRLSADLNVTVEELWAYQAVGDQIRFTLVQRSAAAEKARAAEAIERPKPVGARPAAAPRNGSAARARTTRSAAAKPARRAAPAGSSRRSTTAKAAKPAVRRAAAKTPARKSASRPQKRK
ncbi:MAG TPA: hypothetical protein VL173_17995, partial [Vicinamibacterales bacterium]|nr:hypothetical protein [Vicinamibacterales bacterium]